MKSKLLCSVAASGMLAATLGGCATIPSQPVWQPVQYPVFPPSLPAPPVYAARPAQDVPPAVMETQRPPPGVSNGHSWGHDLAVGGVGAIAGNQLAKRWGGAAAGGAEGAMAGGEALGGAAEGFEGAEALDGLMTIIAEDWWLLL